MSDKYNFGAVLRRHLCLKINVMKNILLFISISLAAGLLFVNLYNSLIDARSWGAALPESIATTREYFKTVNPGDFFRVFSPLNQILALLVLLLFWKSNPSARLFLGAALVLYVLADVFTFAFFYPRNDIMFQSAQLTEVEVLRKAWSEWSAMNWLRTGILVAGVAFSFASLHRIYAVAPENKEVRVGGLAAA